LKAVQVTPVALERVVNRRVFRPTMRTSKSPSRGEGAVEIDPARLGIEGHARTVDENEPTSRRVIGCAFEISKILGPGSLESVYKKAVCAKLTECGL